MKHITRRHTFDSGFRALWLTAAVVLLGCPAPAAPCETNADCTDGAVCNRGLCVPPEASDTGSAGDSGPPVDAGPRGDAGGAVDARVPRDAAIGPDLTSCSGPTFEVSPRGDDGSGDGSAERPFRTLGHATNVVTTPGSTIHLSAGNYRETEQSFLAVGVCLEGEGDETFIQSSLTDEWLAIVVLSSEPGTDGRQHISGLRLDGDDLATAWGIEVAGRSNVSIHHCTIENFRDRGVIFGGRMDGSDGPPPVYATGNSFHDNVLRNSARFTSEGTGCLNIGGQEGMLIYDNVIEAGGRPRGNNGWPIKGWNDGHLRGVRIFDNVITKAPFDGDYNGDRGWDFAIELFNESGLEIYGNTIQGSVDLNFQTRGDYDYSVYIHDNVIGQEVLNTHPETGIILEFGTETGIIENNHIRNVTTGITFNTRVRDVVSDITIRGNLMSNLGRSGSGPGNAGSAIIMVSESTNDYAIRNFFIWNNTMLANADDSPHWGIQMADGATIDNLQIVNNIIGHFATGWFTSNIAITELLISNNDIFDNGGDNGVDYFGPPPVSPILRDNIHGDPLFVSATDYHLTTSSPAVNAGTDVGLPFRGTAPDMGYVESF